jgi:hypothetical protein
MADDLAAAMATVLPSEPEEWLKSLSKAMQDRRNGREGSRVWARHLSKPSRIRPGSGPPQRLPHRRPAADELRRRVGRPVPGDRPSRPAQHLRAHHQREVVEDEAQRVPHRGRRRRARRRDGPSDHARQQDEGLAREVHDFQLWAGDGYAMVTPNDGDIPVITAEDPRETITAHDPATGRARAGSQAVPRRVGRRRPGAPLHRERRTEPSTHFPLIKKGRSTITAGVFRFSKGWELTEPVLGARPDAAGAVPEPGRPRRVRAAPRHPRPDQRPDHVEGRHRQGAGVPADGD